MNLHAKKNLYNYDKEIWDILSEVQRKFPRSQERPNQPSIITLSKQLERRIYSIFEVKTM